VTGTPLTGTCLTLVPYGPDGIHLLTEYLKAAVITRRNSGPSFPDSMDVSSRPLHRDEQSMSLRDRLAVANAAARNVADEGRVEWAVPAQVTLPTHLSGNNAQVARLSGPPTTTGQQAAPTTPAERVETPGERMLSAQSTPATA
jgi:hypothetical protein